MAILHELNGCNIIYLCFSESLIICEFDFYVLMKFMIFGYFFRKLILIYNQQTGIYQLSKYDGYELYVDLVVVLKALVLFQPS